MFKFGGINAAIHSDDFVQECQSRVENGWEFYSFKLLVLERLAFLSLDEEIAANQTSNKVFSKQANLDILLDTVYKLDQALFEAKKIVSCTIL